MKEILQFIAMTLVLVLAIMAEDYLTQDSDNRAGGETSGKDYFSR